MVVCYADERIAPSLVTSATTIIFGKTIWDPVDVLTHFRTRYCW